MYHEREKAIISFLRWEENGNAGERR